MKRESYRRGRASARLLGGSRDLALPVLAFLQSLAASGETPFPIAEAGSRFSDHSVFMERGVPSLWLRAFEPGTRGPAFVEHTPLDTADKVDLAELRAAVRTALRILVHLAESDDLPHGKASLIRAV